MLKLILITLLPLLVFFTNGSDGLVASLKKPLPKAETGTLEKMIVANGTVGMNIDVSRFGAKSRNAESRSFEFSAEPNSFFKILVFNGELRGPLPGSMPLSPQGEMALPGKLGESSSQLVLEHNAWGSRFELAIRDAKSGFTFFDVEGQYYDYDPNTHLFSVIGGRILLSDEYARELGRTSEVGTVVGGIDVSTTMRAIEISEVNNGAVISESLPPTANPEAGTVPGPDVIVGDLTAMIQPSGSASATQVGLAIGTDSCNFGTINLNWFQNPNNDHPVIPQNLYRMSGGATNDERFEQIGQSQVKHAFTALTENICNLGCNNVGGSQLGSGCSDPYSASLNAGPSLGSKAWINPFTGAYPRNDVTDPNLRNNNHAGHTHPSGSPLHRVITNISDLSTTQNPGATYYGEAQYVTPHEYAWCQANPTQCNMNNNVSYRRFNVSGTGSPFSFSPAAATVRMKAAVEAWPGATFVQVAPAPGTDGVAFIAYKVTNPSAGVWRYEYAVYNQNLDRAIQSFSIPVGNGAVLSSIGFHAPPQHPGFSGDGTLNNAGFSSTPWTQNQTAGSMTWSSETIAQNQNANAIRWGSMYNFRFESNRPPQAANATIGFFKTGSPVTAAIVGPSGVVASNVSVGGRVLSSGSRGVNAARVSITDSNNVTRTVVTNSFGFYRFDNVASGSTYTVTVNAKRFSFTPQSLLISDNLTNLDFTALP